MSDGQALREQLTPLLDEVDAAMRVRDRLLAAKLITSSVLGTASDDAVLSVFRELCAVQEVWTEDGASGAETVH